MTENFITNNCAEVIGEITNEFTLSHEVYGEKFYCFTLKIKRLSDISDYIIITVSEHLVASDQFTIGDKVYIEGQFRSYNNYDNVGNKLVLTVFAKYMRPIYEEDSDKNPNSVYFNGYICKPPIFRTTPFGREITDMLIAVNRTYNKSDYIPCIAWGRNARFMGNIPVGSNVRLWGRIQSREYQKKLSETEIITKTAYEVSIIKIEVVNKEEADCQDIQ